MRFWGRISFWLSDDELAYLVGRMKKENREFKERRYELMREFLLAFENLGLLLEPQVLSPKVLGMNKGCTGSLILPCRFAA